MGNGHEDSRTRLDFLRKISKALIWISIWKRYSARSGARSLPVVISRQTGDASGHPPSAEKPPVLSVQRQAASEHEHLTHYSLKWKVQNQKLAWSQLMLLADIKPYTRRKEKRREYWVTQISSFLALSMPFMETANICNSQITRNPTFPPLSSHSHLLASFLRPKRNIILNPATNQ